MTRFFLGSLNVEGPYFHATGEGLTTCAMNEETGEITRVGACALAQNAIWLARAGEALLVAGENYLNPGTLAAFSQNGSSIGHAQSSLGGAACHIAVASDARTAFVASYLGGITVHALDPSGAVAPAHQHITYPGRGARPARQDKSHPHQSALTPDRSHLLVCDLGCDRIWAHAFDGTRLGEPQAIAVSPGSGPRHLAIHPTLPRFYLLGELDAKLRLFEGSGADWREIAVYTTLPEAFIGEPAGAAVKFHPSGKTLFVSNRHSDTITCFAVDARGNLAHAATFAGQGQTPRDIALSPSGRWLIAVNQDSHILVPFELDPTSGMPTGKTGPAFACGSPFCALF